MSLSIIRGGASQTLSLTAGRKGDIGWLGVLPVDETKTVNPGPVEAPSMSVRKNIRDGRLISPDPPRLITRETSPKQLMGPLGIAQLSGETAQLGWSSLFGLMAMISLNLGLLNLLPIPILDGGHITIMALEGLARRDFSVRVKEKMLLAGFVVLMVLMVTVISQRLDSHHLVRALDALALRLQPSHFFHRFPRSRDRLFDVSRLCGGGNEPRFEL